MHNPPGYQLLHCIRPSTEGGESVFADAFHASKKVYLNNPEAFNVLRNYPVHYAYSAPGSGVDYSDCKPVIELQKALVYDGLATKWETPNNEPLIRAVNWAPQFQGHFLKVPTLDSPDTVTYARETKFGTWLHAAKLFAKYAQESVVTVKLKAGECVIFNNRRILHGRRAFPSKAAAELANAAANSGEGRWLKGCYVDTDVVESRFHVLRRAAAKSVRSAMRPD